jgi:RND superfamily putative drug exporter
LVPAVIAIIGPRMFWPYRLAGLGKGWHATPAGGIRPGASKGAGASDFPPDGALSGGAEGRSSPRWSIWPGLARLIVARPALVAVVTLAVLAPAVVKGGRVTWVYDTLAAIEPANRDGAGNGAMGVEMVKRHWPVGEIAPVVLVVQSDRPLAFDQWIRVSSAITQAVSKFDEVRNVRSVSWPLGKEAARRSGLFASVAASHAAAPEYLSKDGKAMRMDVVLNQPALTLEAMEEVRQLRTKILPDVLASAGMAAGNSLAHASGSLDSAAHASGSPDSVDRAASLSSAQVAAQGPRLQPYILGPTAEMIDTRAVTSSDFHRVAVLVLAVILVMVTLLLKDVILAAFMVGCTLLSYLTTLGITAFVFSSMGEPGLDWKVQIFLFVVIAAVGVDYNIFLGARLAQEAAGRIGDARQTAREAVRSALTHTGPVISSCGLIMAATLGSLMAGELKLLHELGFALAAGMLIDTFVTRPLLLPAFVAITGRTGKAARRTQPAA